MKMLIAAIAVILLLLGSTAYGGWYVPPRVVHAYYPAPPAYAYPASAYAYPAPAYAYPAPAYYYRAPVMRPMPYTVYSPVVPAPMWVGPRGVVVRGKVYIPGRPIRNAVRAVLP